MVAREDYDGWTNVGAPTAISVCLGVAIMVVYYINRGDLMLYRVRPITRPKHLYPSWPKTVRAWLAPLAGLDAKEMLSAAGLDLYMVCRVLQLGFRWTGCATLLGWVMLVPAYATAGHLEGFNRLTMANIPAKGNLTWLCVPYMYAMTAFLCWLLIKEWQTFVRLRVKHLSQGLDPHEDPQPRYTVMVTSIPENLRHPNDLLEYFNKIFPGQTATAEVLYDTHELDATLAERDRVLDKLERALLAENVLGKTQWVHHNASWRNCWGGQEVSIKEAVLHYQERLRDLTRDIVEWQEQWAKVDIVRRTCKVLQLNAEAPEPDLLSRTKDRALAVTDKVKQAILADRPVSPSTASDLSVYVSQDSSMGSQEMGLAAEEAAQLEDTVTETFTNRVPFSMQADEHKDDIEAQDSTTVHSPMHRGRENTGQGSGVRSRAETVPAGHPNSPRTPSSDTGCVQYIEATGTGFVTFNTLVTKAAVLSAPVSDKPLSMRVEYAPEPSDVYWENMSYSYVATTVRHVVATWALYSLACFFFIPLGALQAISAVSKGQNLVVTSYIPIIGALLLIRAIPLALETVAQKLVKLRSKDRMERWMLHRHFIFLVGYVIGSIFFGIFFNSLSDVFKKIHIADVWRHPQDVLDSISKNLPTVGVFFFNYIMSEAFVSGAMEFSRIVDVFRVGLRVWFRDKRLITRRYYQNHIYTLRIHRPKYGSRMPRHLLIMLISFVFAPIAPMVALGGFCFFAIWLVVMKHKAVFMFLPTFETGGYYWYFVYKRITLGWTIAVITVGVYLLVKAAWRQALLLLPILFLWHNFYRFCTVAYLEPSNVLPLEKARELDGSRWGQRAVHRFQHDAYRQPSLKDPAAQTPEPTGWVPPSVHLPGTLNPDTRRPSEYNLFKERLQSQAAKLQKSHSLASLASVGSTSSIERGPQPNRRRSSALRIDRLAAHTQAARRFLFGYGSDSNEETTAFGNSQGSVHSNEEREGADEVKETIDRLETARC